MKISIFEKSRAPSRNVFRKGLVDDCWCARLLCSSFPLLLEPSEIERPEDQKKTGEDVEWHFHLRRSDETWIRSRSSRVELLERSGENCKCVCNQSEPETSANQHERDSKELTFQSTPPCFKGFGLSSQQRLDSAYHSITGVPRQAQQKITVAGVSHFLTHWIKKFSSPKMRNRQFVFAPKIEYKLVAERSEANQNSLTFPIRCRREESNFHQRRMKPPLYH